MKPTMLPFRAGARPMCQLCAHIVQQPAYRRTIITTTTSLKTSNLRRQLPSRTQGAYVYMQTSLGRRTFLFGSKSKKEPVIETPQETAMNAIPLATQIKGIEKHIESIINSPKVEPEEKTLQALSHLEYVAKRAIAIRGGRARGAKLNLRQSSASAILSIGAEDTPAVEEATSKKSKKNQKGQKSQKSPEEDEDDLPSPSYISQMAQALIHDEKVFLSEDVLRAYVNLQKLLARPYALAEALYLYAHKPVPQLGSSPPVFKEVNPRHYKQAIPADISDTALEAAIAAKDMALSMKVIDWTVTAPAWKNKKWMFKFGPPFAAFAASPFAIYAVASEIGLYGGYLSETFFKWHAFAGLCTYVYGCGILGWVALTTWSTHHVRVVWRPGVSLLDRWMAEDERAALDKIAMAWGFKETWKMGDETGEDWEALRKTCFMRKMWLDKPDLMPGMNPPLTGEM